MPKQLSATTVLVAINVAIFVLAAWSPSAKELLDKNLPLFFPLNDKFHLWQIVTTLFMHGGISHLFMNMFGLYSFGSLLERIWGTRRFLIFYFVAGIGASLVYSAVNYIEYKSTAAVLEENGISQQTLNVLNQLENTQNDLTLFELTLVSQNRNIIEIVGKESLLELFKNHNVPAVGASGAIYGILTAFCILFPNAKLSLIFLPIPISAKVFVPVLVAIDLFSGITGFSLFGGGIAHFAHIGGALIGFLLMMLWRKDLKNQQYEYEIQ